MKVSCDQHTASCPKTNINVTQYLQVKRKILITTLLIVLCGGREVLFENLNEPH
jgi:hypothetical protein